MLRRFSASAVKSWLKFSVKDQNGVFTTFRVIDLPKNLVEDYVEFQIKKFVSREIFHRAAGLNNSIKALDEYRDVLKHTCVTPPYHSIVCCPEVDGHIVPKIVATSTVKLNKIHEEYGFDYKANTNEVKKLFQILRDLNNLYPISNVMEKYGVDKVFEYDSMTVHPDYARLGIASKMGSIRNELCLTYNVPMCVAWMTSEGSKKAAEHNYWVKEIIISRDEVAKRLKVVFEDIPSTYPFFHFMIYRFPF